MTDTLNVNLPFPGFYESDYSHALDFEEEQLAEYLAECAADPEREEFQPEAYRLTSSDYAELLLGAIDYGAAYRKIAEFYVEAFDAWAADNLGTPANAFRFEALTSPREYNFATDRLFADVPLAVMQELFNRSAADHHETLAAYIRERFTSRDGFSSFYSNEIADWLEKPLANWDHNELGTLLGAAIQAVADPDIFARDLYEYTFSGNNEEGEALDTGLDWDKLNAARDALLEERRAEAIEAGDYEPAEPQPYRCPLTLDLFAAA